jgi:hypothetical protein
MNLLSALARADDELSEHGAQRWRKKSREAPVLDRLRSLRCPGESFSDVILRLAAEG